MALKQLKLGVELKQRKNQLAELMAKQSDFKSRAEQLSKSLEEAETEEDMKTVQTAIDELEKEETEADVEKGIADVNAEITRIESELADLDERMNGNQQTENKHAERGAKKMDMTVNRFHTRKLIESGEYYERKEVKEFYENLKNIKQRAISGEGLTIPQIIVNRIFDIMGDYCTIYPLVDQIRVSGTARILLDTDTTPATWIEQTGTIPNGDVGTITNVDFDGFKVGKLVFVDNAILQDSIINVDDYVTKKIARALALALDLAILKGKGSTAKEPVGIIPSLKTDHKVDVSSGKLVDIVKNISLIDTGADSVGEIVAVMKRSTYYNRFLEYTINVDSNGNVVGKLPNLSQPDLLGLRVVFNNNMDDNAVLFGDFSKYTIVERETINIASSEHVKFAEDQTAFRGKGRFDGKPVNKDAFVLVTISDAAKDVTETNVSETPSGE